MNRYILLFALTVFCCRTYAQQIAPGEKTDSKVEGSVVDSSNQKPIEYATITVAGQKSKKTIRHAITDVDGNFRITGLPNGIYTINIDIIGYQSKQINNIEISDVNNTISLNTVSLNISNKSLDAVIINSKKIIVENKIDKTIYNVSNDITSQGGTAIDVLKKVPQVSVDIDGNVELQGNADIRFLINGKPSSIFGNSLADALASIPANQIKSIEVIPNPGAKYDAQGTGGIINIILKDNKLQGINGNISVSAGTRFENGSFNLSLRRSNFGINAFFNGNTQLSSHTPNTQNRLSTDTGAATNMQLLENGYTDFERSSYQSGIGFDWSITKKDNITASLSYSHFDNHSTSFTNQEQITTDINNIKLSDISSFRNSNSRSGINSIDYNIDYKKKFKKDGQELEILYTASLGNPTNNYLQTQTYINQGTPYTGSSSTNPGTDNENDISIDYSYPINKNLLFETGAKSIFQDINSTANVSMLDTSTNKYVPDTTQSYNLNYKMKIYAGYISATFPLFNYLNAKAGLRYEYTDVSISFPNTSIPSYYSLVPSLILSHNFNKKQSLKIVYSRRIERPNYNELNPFVNLSDPYNITTGNPLLKPEIGNNFELGYNKNFVTGATVYIALLERINTDDIKPYTSFYPDYVIGDSTYRNVSVSTRKNIGTEYNSGIIISGSVPVKNKLSLRSNLQLLQQRNVDTVLQGGTTIAYKFRINLNATYQLPHDLSLELFGNYNSAFNSIQGRIPELFTYTFAFRKEFWNKKAFFGFTATNPFNRYINQLTTVFTNNYSSYNMRQVPYRSFGINFSYKFGKLEFKKAKEDDTDYINNPPN